MNKLTLQRLGLLFSGVFLCLFLIALGYTSIAGRWGSFAGALWLLIATAIWMIWIGQLIWMSVKWTSAAKSLRVFCFLGAVLASFIGGSVVIRAGGVVRTHEIQKSVDAGLYEDCQRLLNNWPTNKELIEYNASEFAKLPASIQILKPVYLENDNIDDTNLPPNVGICINGFGGFYRGVRVFRNDQDASLFATNTIGGCERIAPGVYYWWHPT
jgi:hypothetical protein